MKYSDQEVTDLYEVFATSTTTTSMQQVIFYAQQLQQAHLLQKWVQ